MLVGIVGIRLTRIEPGDAEDFGGLIGISAVLRERGHGIRNRGCVAQTPEMPVDVWGERAVINFEQQTAAGIGDPGAEGNFRVWHFVQGQIRHEIDHHGITFAFRQRAAQDERCRAAIGVECRGRQNAWGIGALQLVIEVVVRRVGSH